MGLRIKGLKTNELLKRLIVLAVVMLVFRLGNTVPLFGVELTQSKVSWNAENIMTSMLSGTNNQFSWMALGLMPYINASLLVNFVVLSKSQEKKERITHKQIEGYTELFTLIFALISVGAHTTNISYSFMAYGHIVARHIVMLQLLLGTMILYLDVQLNKKHGIGGTTPIIFFNISRSIVDMIRKGELDRNVPVIIFCIILVILILFFEYYIIKIPLQRVSIHNIHADQNYLAFKLNPIGMLPVMFATALFIVGKNVIDFLSYTFPNDPYITRLADNFIMTKKEGAIIFVSIIVILAIGFSYVILSPTEVSKNLMKSGDSIIGIPSGKPTRRYLRRILFLLSLNSGFVEGTCVGISLWLVISNLVPETAAMMPMNLMLVTSFVVSIFQEIKSYRLYDAYSFFL